MAVKVFEFEGDSSMSSKEIAARIALVTRRSDLYRTEDIPKAIEAGWISFKDGKVIVEIEDHN